MLKIRVFNISKNGARHGRSSASRAPPGTRARSSRRSTRQEYGHVRRRALSAAWSATTTSTTRARRRAAGPDGADRGGRPLPVHRGRLAHAHADGDLAGARQPARPHQDLRNAGVRPVALPARVGRLAVHRPGHAAIPGADTLWRKNNPVEEFDFEEDTEGAEHGKFTWANSAFAMAIEHHPVVQAVRLVLAASAAWSRAARSRACPSTRSRPTMAAST